MTDKFIQMKDVNGNNLFPCVDYNNATNIPSINSVPLIGNRTIEELGIYNSGKDLLWTNPAPSEVFPAQTISFNKDITGYDAFIVTTNYANNPVENMTTNLVLNNGIRQNIYGGKDPTLSSPYFNYRGVTFTSNSAIFTLAAYIGSANTYNQNHHCIPQQIYGIYFGAKLLGNSGVNNKELLWTNPSPTTAFAAQEVTLNHDASDFDAFIIETNYGISVGYKHTNLVLNDGAKHSLIAPRDASATTYTIAWRDVLISGNKANFTQALYLSNSGGATETALSVPLSIYGIYFGTKNVYNYTYNINGANIDLLDLLYPIGSIYLSVSSANPETLFGGTWSQIAQGQTLWSAGVGYSAGTSISPGLPDIQGTAGPLDDYSKNNLSGAMTNAGAVQYDATSSTSGAGWKLQFKASDYNSIYGNSNTVQPPAFCVYMWQRTA